MAPTPFFYVSKEFWLVLLNFLWLDIRWFFQVIGGSNYACNPDDFL